MENVVKKLRVGVIGCGRVSVMHLGSIALLPEAELIACCDIKKDRAEAAAKHPLLPVTAQQTQNTTGAAVRNPDTDYQCRLEGGKLKFL